MILLVIEDIWKPLLYRSIWIGCVPVSCLLAWMIGHLIRYFFNSPPTNLACSEKEDAINYSKHRDYKRSNEKYFLFTYMYLIAPILCSLIALVVGVYVATGEVIKL